MTTNPEFNRAAETTIPVTACCAAVKLLASCLLWLLVAVRTAPGVEAPARAGPLSFCDLFACELETYLVLDGRETLSGKLVPRGGEAVQSLCTTTAPRLCVRLVPLSPGALPFEIEVEVPDDRWKKELPLAIPVARLSGGYYRMEGEVTTADGTSAARGEATDATGTPILLCVRQFRADPPNPPDEPAGGYLAFVRRTIECLRRDQSATLGGKPDGVPFITVSRPVWRSYRSLGHKRPDGTYQNYWFPESPLEYRPVVADLEAWIVLDRLSELTGDPRYGELVAAMAEAFAGCGFDPPSGLGYLGESAAFDVVRMNGVPSKTGATVPYFKPKNTGTYPQLPLDRLWAAAPGQTHRMFRAMYLGLVTDPASMDFNRFCPYGFRDTDGGHVMKRNPGHCGFETAAARMIHWWASTFARTGDEDCLAWAQQMADKWRGVQDPQSGLIPNFFGAVAWEEGAAMPPGEWAEPRGAALAAVSWLDAAAALRTRPAGRQLADQLTEMADRTALGVVRYAYDPERRIFREHLHLDGRPFVGTARYCFRTQTEKDAAVVADPAMAQVKVYDGSGLYQPCSYWEHCAGSTIPLDLAQVMSRSGNAELTDLLRRWVPDLADEARRQSSAVTDDGAWTFRASGEYVHVLVLLYRQTGKAQYLALAREIATAEMERLDRIEYPQWWRMPQRTALLDGLLALHAAVAEDCR